jgi:hypothetical protein
MYDMPNTLAYYRKFENKQESFTGRGLSKAGAVLMPGWSLLLCLQMLDLDESV